MGYDYDTSPLSRTARELLARDPGAPRTDEEIVQLGRELLLPSVRRETPLPQASKAGCDELRASRFWNSVRANPRVEGLAELEADLIAELSPLLPGGGGWLYPQASNHLAGQPFAEIFRLRYDSALCTSRYDTLFSDANRVREEGHHPSHLSERVEPSDAVRCDQRALTAFDMILEGPEGEKNQLKWLELFEAATGARVVDSHSTESEEVLTLPIDIYLGEIDGSVHGQVTNDQAIQLNLLSFLENRQLVHITLAHEIFHLFQYATGMRDSYGAAESGVGALASSGAWFSEGTASWAETLATGRVVDLRKYENLITKPSLSLWKRSYDFAPALNVLNAESVLLVAKPEDPDDPGAAVLYLINALKNPPYPGGGLSALLGESTTNREFSQGFQSLVTQMNSTVEGEEFYPIANPLGPMAWSDLRKQLKPYVVPLEVNKERSEFVFTGEVSGYAYSVFEFPPKRRLGRPLQLEFQVDTPSNGEGSVLVSLLGTNFKPSPTPDGGASYFCELKVDVGDMGPFNPEFCWLEAGEPLRVRFDPEVDKVRVAVIGVDESNDYTISARLTTP